MLSPSTRWIVVVFTSLMLCESVAIADDAAALADLAGEWKRISQETGGEKQVIDAAESLRIRIRGDKLTLWQDDKQIEGFEATLKLTPTTDPKLIDLELPDGKRLEGIYKLEDKHWTLCLQADPDIRERPPAFESKGGDKRVLVVLEKIGG